MKHELIGGYPAAGRELMGRFLRHAFPLDLQSFATQVSSIREHDREDEELSYGSSFAAALLARMH